MFGRLGRSVGSRARRYRLTAAATTATAIVAAYTYHNSDTQRHTLHASSSTTARPAQPTASPTTASNSQQPPSLVFPPSRSDSLAALKRPDVIYDLLIIGGGATGSGIALDASLRGLNTALVEASDFSSGASSRSTKLIHGGIRYLQKAFTQLDVAQYNLVVEALSERRHLLAIAPHLAHSFPIIVPVYAGGLSGLFWVPYYYVGCKLYDVVAGKAAVLERSYFLSAKGAVEKFPMLKDEGLWGGVVYYDGQHNDTRMNVSIVLTAAAQGAKVANHCRVTSLLTEGAAAAGESGAGRVVGARVRDELTGEEWNIRAREVINATGPLTDGVRHMADPASPSCITPSAGIHIVLPASYSPPDMGLIVPKTSDGRVLFLLPWEGSTLVGTTDYLSPVTALPSPLETDIEFLLREISGMLKVDVKRDDVRSVWSGIRPLARDVKATSTEGVNRDHLIERTWDGLTTISGGKWTTYRKMAEDVLDTVMKRQDELRDRWEKEPGSGVLKEEWLIDTSRVKPCSTWCFPVLGTHNFTPKLADDLLAQYGNQLSAVTSTPASSSSAPTPPSASLTTSPSHTTSTPTPSSIIHHLTHNYGDRAPVVLSVASQRSDFSLLSPHFPFLTAELLYAVRYEYAMRVVDVLAHRTRLCFLDTAAAEQAVGRVVEVMGAECGWDAGRRREEVRQAKRFLETMKCSVTKEAKADATVTDNRAADESSGLEAAVA